MIKIADISMDNVNIEIQSSSEKASQGVNALINTLNNLNSALSGIQNNVNKYLINMNKVANVSKKINLPNSYSFKTSNTNSKEMNYLNSGKSATSKMTSNNLGGNNKSLKSLKVDLGSVGKIAAQTAGRIGEMFKKIAKAGIVTAGIKALKNGFTSLGKTVGTVGGKMRSFAKHLAIYAGGIFGIRSAFYAVKNSVNEFLNSQNAVAKQLSVNISYLKYAVGSSLTPVITFLTNLIYKLLSAIQYVVYYFSKVNIFANASAKSMGTAASNAGKTTKELQKQLQAFDELNNVNFENNAGSGAGGGAGAATPSFDLTDIDESFGELFGDIDNWGKRLAEKINNALSKINWQPLLDGAEFAANKLAKILNDFTYYLDFSLLGYSIAQGFNVAFTFIDTFFQKYDWSQLGHKLAEGLNSIVETLQWDRLGRILTDGFRAAILTLEGFVVDFDFIELGKKFGEMLISAFRNIPWDELANAINVGFTGILDTIITFLDTVPWDEVGKTIGKFLNDINWKEIISKLFQVIIKVGQGLLSALWNGIFSGSDTMVLAGLVGSLALIKGSLGGLLSIASVTGGFSKFVEVAGGISKIIPAIKNVAAAFGKISLVVGGVALAVGNFISMWQNGVTNLKAALMTLGVVLAAVGAVLLGVSAPIAAIVAAVVLLVASIALLTKEFVSNKAQIKSVKKAQEEYNKTVEDAAEKEQTYEDAIDKATDTLEKLEEAERETGLSGKDLYDQVEKGTLVYGDMTQQQREVYKAYKENKTAQEEATEATNKMTEAKEAEKKASWELQLSTAKESKNYDDLKKSVVDAFEKGELSADEARDLIERSMASMSQSSHETFTEDLPSDIKDGLEPDKYASGARKFGNWFRGIWDNLKNTVRDWWNTHIAPWFTKEKWLNLANKAKTGIENKFNEWKSKFHPVKEWWDNKIAPWFTKEKWLNIANKAKSGIENKFNEWKKNFHPIRDWWDNKIKPWFTKEKWQNLADKAVSGLKSAFSNFKFPHIKLPHFEITYEYSGATAWAAQKFFNMPGKPKFTVNWYAQGGFPNAGELFVANEAGAEMIGNIGNKTAVANNDQITKAIANATYRAISQALSENGEDGQPIVINIGNETIYKGFAKSRSQASNQYGITV